MGQWTLQAFGLKQPFIHDLRTISTSTQRTVSGAAGQPGPVVLSLLRASNALNDVPFTDLQTCDQVLSRIYNA